MSYISQLCILANTLENGERVKARNSESELYAHTHKKRLYNKRKPSPS